MKLVLFEDVCLYTSGCQDASYCCNIISYLLGTKTYSGLI